MPTEKDRYIENLIEKACAKIWGKENFPECPGYTIGGTSLRGWQEVMFEIRRQEQRSNNQAEYSIPTDKERDIRASLRSIIPRVSSTSNWGDNGKDYYYWFKLPGDRGYADISFHRKDGVLYWDLYLPKHLLENLCDRYLAAGYKRDKNTLYKTMDIGNGFDRLSPSDRERKLDESIQDLLRENASLFDADR